MHILKIPVPPKPASSIIHTPNNTLDPFQMDILELPIDPPGYVQAFAEMAQEFERELGVPLLECFLQPIPYLRLNICVATHFARIGRDFKAPPLIADEFFIQRCRVVCALASGQRVTGSTMLRLAWEQQKADLEEQKAAAAEDAGRRRAAEKALFKREALQGASEDDEIH